jgi:PAS domain S-box-containing protein
MAAAGIFMGLAIAGMHYTGMAAIRTSGSISYDPAIVGASIAIAILVSLVAIAVIRNLIGRGTEKRLWLKKIGASLLVGLAVVGMHHSGMAAAQFVPGPAGWRTTDNLVVSTYELGLVVAIISVALLVLALFATQFERWTIATRSKFENLLALAPQVVWFSDADGRISYCNPYWYDYTGLSRRESLGDEWLAAIHPDDRDGVAESWKTAVRDGTNFEVELRLRRNDGEYCWFLARCRPHRDETGTIDAWLGIAVDIEERKRAEESALAASQAKSEFLASMSHELRTPLNAIGGYGELLAMGVHGSLNAEQAQDIARIRRSQQHLLTLINDVLNFARVDAGQAEYRLTSVPVDEALRDTESMIAPQIIAKDLRYTYKGGDKTISVLADPEKLQQIVLNLLSNAVKFTDRGGSITLSATAAGKCIEIAVEDTGAGIPKEKLERIFDPFVQAQRRLNQPVQGVGLGLAISRDLAHGMDGELTVESKMGAGSTFTLSLPRAPRMDPADVPRPQLGDDQQEQAADLKQEQPVESADSSLHEATHP